MSTKKIAKSAQYELFISDVHTVINGIELGVLENGLPYLSQRGLARMAGIDRKLLRGLSNQWSANNHEGNYPLKIKELLSEYGYNDEELFIKIKVDGKITYAYTEPVCLAILEYCAYDAPTPIKQALDSIRKLNRAGFRLFVYGATGYNPKNKELDSWKYFHDRVDLIANKVPAGYYCIFQEIAGLIVSLIKNGVSISDKIIPDISVGATWASYWKNNNMSESYGDRINYKHSYPDYYPQSQSNPQDAKAYPEKSLGEFRKWFREEYLVKKFPKYILEKLNLLDGGKSQAEAIIESITNKKIENK